jgi:hypothetical protein
MKNENLSEISTDDLKKKEKVTRLITSVYWNVVIVCIINLYYHKKRIYTVVCSSISIIPGCYA